MRTGLRWAAVALALALAPGAGRAGDRSVTIIEGVPEPIPEAPSGQPGQALPDTAAPANVALPNPAGVNLDMLPGRTVRVGDQIAFRVTSRKPGFLLLFDVDADGRVLQIYPSAASLARLKGDAAKMNALAPDKPVRIPDAASPLASFAFRAAPPRGAGLILAALSGTPVSKVDLQAVGGKEAGPPQRLQRLVQAIQDGAARATDASDPPSPDAWSFATLSYAIE